MTRKSDQDKDQDKSRQDGQQEGQGGRADVPGGESPHVRRILQQVLRGNPQPVVPGGVPGVAPAAGVDDFNRPYTKATVRQEGQTAREARGYPPSSPFMMSVSRTFLFLEQQARLAYTLNQELKDFPSALLERMQAYCATKDSQALLHAAVMGASLGDDLAARGNTIEARSCWELVVDALESASMLGRHEAQYLLSMLLLAGKEVEQDLERSVRLLLLSSKANNPEAHFALAWFYQTGAGSIEQNPVRSLELLRLAAQQNEPRALFHLFQRHMDGDELVARDPALAVEYCRQAALEGFTEAQLVMSDMCRSGEGEILAKNREEALYWLEMARESGSLDALLSLGMFWLLEDDDWGKSAECFHEAAVKGSANGRALLSFLYGGAGANPREETADQVLAWAWAALATDDVSRHPDKMRRGPGGGLMLPITDELVGEADEGHHDHADDDADAQDILELFELLSLDRMFEAMTLTQQEAALQCLQRMREGDYPPVGASECVLQAVQESTRLLYEDDPAAAMRVLQQLRERAQVDGMPLSCIDMGNIAMHEALSHEHGRGAPRDMDRARACYREAAEFGNTQAQCQVGMDLLRQARRREEAAGRKSRKSAHKTAQKAARAQSLHDMQEASYWLRLAAEKQEAVSGPAMLLLASLYSSGSGVPENLEQAVYWRMLAHLRHEEMDRQAAYQEEVMRELEDMMLRAGDDGIDGLDDWDEDEDDDDLGAMALYRVLDDDGLMGMIQALSEQQLRGAHDRLKETGRYWDVPSELLSLLSSGLDHPESMP